mmetsp:Transcript_11395/g.42543  ORF Transcript_11395/g.42543 Transcript_11395/m.42543 type:complete len:261 (+) Transcript_11395:180-962(+)
MARAVFRLLLLVVAFHFCRGFSPLRASTSRMESALPADAMMQAKYEELVDRVKAMESSRDKPLWIGIAGCPGSGKTSLSLAVGELLSDAGTPTAVLPMDGFHFYRSELDSMPDPEAAHARRGAPFTFNAEKLVAALEQLKIGLSESRAGLSWPSFDHEAGDPVEDGIVVPPATRVVLVEGNYLLLGQPEPWNRVRSVFDEMWYIDVETAVAVQRVARRHMKAWGWDYERAFARAADSDRANMELIVSQGRDEADLYIQSV